MPRLVRRKPRLERLKDYLNPGDFLLWLSEEFETRNWDSKQFGLPVALVLHFVLLVARANQGGNRGGDDVFGDDYSGTGWLGYISTFIVHCLSYLSIANALYTFLRKRHYRLFENSIDAQPSTPSAHRVRVDSSPIASSPLRFLTSILGDTSAESRAHPDPTRDVWELSVWDPIPICLQLFCLFSPGHVLVYWLFLPTLSSDPRPSMTVFTTIILQVLISTQLSLLKSSFSQQEKDSAIIHKEVMSEYDIKYVHPRLNPLVRDVGTQFTGPISHGKTDTEGGVDTYTPTIILKRGFRTNPNPNYAKHIDPDNTGAVPQRGFSPISSLAPTAYSREPTPFTGVTPRTAIRQPQFRQSISGVSIGVSTGDGGSLGVFSHANSPLKKASSMYDMQIGSRPKNSFEMASREIREERERSRSPAKRQSMAPKSLLGSGRMLFPGDENERRTSAPVDLSLGARSSGLHDPHKRGPSRW